MGYYLRLFPEITSRNILDERKKYTAVLCGLPSNIKATDLKEIISTSGARSVGIPRIAGSYKNKPWAYLAFTSEDAMINAIEISCAVKGAKLSWCELKDVRHLCIRCAASGHKSKNCASPIVRGRTPTPKNIQRQYDRFRPAGHSIEESAKRAARYKSRSRSRSHSRDPTNKRKQDDRSDHFSSSTEHPLQKKSVSYVNAAASNSLNNSAHSSQNRNNNNNNNNNNNYYCFNFNNAFNNNKN